MIHKKCGNKVMLDCTSMFVLQSPSININTKGISPGMIQIDSSKSKGNARLFCPRCVEYFENKEDFEKNIVDNCEVCSGKYPPSEIIISDYGGGVCVHCATKIKSGKKSETIHENKMLSVYGGFIKENNPTLLTILLKK